MGIGYNGVLALLKLKQEGCDFSKVATLGRHYLYIKPSQLKKAFRKFGWSISDEDCSRIFANPDGSNEKYQETLLKFLGANEIVSFDASNYEGCSCVFDFNSPIPEKFHEKFTCVLDFGSCEHVFNFPQAIKNLMDLCRIGGHVALETPNNNLGGHGFYQFCPELFSALFNKSNGFELEKMYLYFMNKNMRASKIRPYWYQSMCTGRVDICDDLPSILFFWSKKIAAVKTLNVKESYYQELYKRETVSSSIRHSFYSRLKGFAVFQPLVGVLRFLRNRLFPRRHFNQVFKKTYAWET